MIPNSAQAELRWSHLVTPGLAPLVDDGYHLNNQSRSLRINRNYCG